MAGMITNLRDVVPIRPLTRMQAMRVAERQATRFLQLSGITEPAVPDAIIAGLPRLSVERLTPSPVSGASQWSGGRWLIILSGSEPATRQRFSLAHEFKHVLDHPFIDLLYPATKGQSSHERAEQVCDYFAGCLLMPRTWVRRSLVRDTRDVWRLAQLFGVSPTAMQVRLLQIALMDLPTRSKGVRNRCAA